MGTSSPTKSILIAFPEELLPDVTMRTAVAVLVSEPLVPVMVRVELPMGVLEAVATVSVELAPALTEVGLNVPVALAGKPLTLKLIVPVKPLAAVVLTV
jgi:hypothetical protein